MPQFSFGPSSIWRSGTSGGSLVSKRFVTPNLKQQVHDYWNRQSCGTEVATSPKFSREYFDEIEEYRYEIEPEIFRFAQFSRFHGQRLLEVGVGAGSDFLQWVRSGCRAYGVDLTREGITHVRHRLTVYGLPPQPLLVGDCERLPFKDGTFDLVYSWGVIHHTPDTQAALGEIVRVTRPGGLCKIMVYNRHSVSALSLWLRVCLLRGRPWRSVTWALYHHQESPGTKGFTAREVQKMLSSHPVGSLRVESTLTCYDRMVNGRSLRDKIMRGLARLCTALLGWHQPGWFLCVEFRKLA